MSNNIQKIYDTMDYGLAPESTELAEQWLSENDNCLNHYIDGKWQKPKSGKYFKGINPSNLKQLVKIADGDGDDVNKAVTAASKALTSWKKLSGHARARYLYAIARQIQKHSRLFAVLESIDNGKPIRESRDIDIPLVIRHFYHHAGWAQVRDKEFPDMQEVGVVGQIIPWNFPLLMMAWKIAPALAMGNTVVLKPAEFTSVTAILFAQICQEVGLPAGVVNIVTGDAKAGQALVEHKGVAKIAFTGSTEVGRIIRRATAGSGKKLSLELGGKSPFIVFEDADLDAAVEGLVDAIWFNQGQVCCAGSRLLVQESVADKLITKVKRRMEKLTVSDPLDKNTDIGTIVDPSQLKQIEKLMAIGEKEGATKWQPRSNSKSKDKATTKGCYCPPTLFTDVAPASTIAQQEIFGPVLVAMSFRTPSEAVALANNTRFGLASSVWTENINLALDIAPKIKAGVVWVNSTNTFDAAAGFGGYRESGFGREGGREGLYEYLTSKADAKLTKKKPVAVIKAKATKASSELPAIDKTAKLYIGGKQQRPDGGYSLPAFNAAGQQIGEIPDGNRKDIRNAVEAANAATGWTKASGHNRAQVLYYLAENLSYRSVEFAKRIAELSGKTVAQAKAEVEQSIDRIYTYAAMADKYDGDVHQTPMRAVTIAMKEAIGVMGVVCPEESPLLGLVSTLAPAIAMGNRIVLIPSQQFALLATDFYQLLETSDVPSGVVNIVTGNQEVLAEVLAKHLDVEGLWYFGSAAGSEMVELLSADNMKRTWVSYGKYRDWSDAQQGEGDVFLRAATQIKNIWVPYGE